MKNAAVLGLLCVALTGCLTNSSSRNVDMVKGSTFSGIDKNVTIGKALTERPICKEITWEDKVNEYNEPIVEYRCQLSDYQTVYANANKQRLNDELARSEEKRYAAMRSITMAQEETDKLYKEALQVLALEEALYTIQNQGINKEYERVSKALNIKRHNYQYIFDSAKVYKIKPGSSPDQIEINWLENRIRNIFIDAGIKKDYYEKLGLNMAYEGGTDLLKLSEPEIVGYIARKQQDIYKRGMDVEAVIAANKVILYSLRTGKERVEDFTPRTVEQVIQFNVNTSIPVPAYCNFYFDNTPNDQEKSSIHTSYCLKMAYDKKYNESFKQLFTENFETKLSLKH